MADHTNYCPAGLIKPIALRQAREAALSGYAPDIRPGDRIVSPFGTARVIDYHAGIGLAHIAPDGHNKHTTLVAGGDIRVIAREART